MIVVINRNMSCEHVRPLNNRFDILQKHIISSHIIESFFYCFVFYSFLCNLNQFVSSFKPFKLINK